MKRFRRNIVLWYKTFWFSHKAMFYIGAVLSVLGWSFHWVLWENSFYHLTVTGVSFYVRAYYLKTKGVHSLWVFSIWLSTVVAVEDELFGDPTAFELNEYIGTALIAVITYFYRNKWMR